MKVSKWLENVVFRNKTNRMDQINIIVTDNTNKVIYCWPKDSDPIPHWINEQEIMKIDFIAEENGTFTITIHLK